MKQVEYRKNIPPAQNVNVKCESDLQFRPHLISTKARIPFFVFFFLSLVFWTAILDFCGGFRWQLVPRLPFPVPRSPLPVPRFSNIRKKTVYNTYWFYIRYACSSICISVEPLTKGKYYQCWVLGTLWKSQKLIPSKENQSVLIAKISSRKTQKIDNPQK